jgi:hypothetical protein
MEVSLILSQRAARDRSFKLICKRRNDNELYCMSWQNSQGDLGKKICQCSMFISSTHVTYRIGKWPSRNKYKEPAENHFKRPGYHSLPWEPDKVLFILTLHHFESRWPGLVPEVK